MLTVMICSTAFLVTVLVHQYLKIKRLKERNGVLHQDRLEWFEEYLKTKSQLRKTQKICNVAFESTLRYKKELATLKEAKEVRVEIKTIDFNDFDPEAIGRLLAKQIMAKHIVKDSDVQSSQQSKKGAAS